MSSHYDVIVAGGGPAGIMAAMVAADEGAKVLLLEKMDKLGGSWHLAGGTTSGAATRIQFESGILDDTPSRYYADCMQEARARQVCDPEVLWYYCVNTGHIVDWLDTLGAYPKECREAKDPIYFEPWTRKRSYYYELGMKHATVYLDLIEKELDKRVKRGDVEIMLSTPVTDLIKKDGKIVGLKAKGPDGKEKEYLSGAVVVCTGGFTSNLDLIRKYKWPNASGSKSLGWPGNTGDGLVWSEKIGAKLVNMDQEMAPYPGGVPDDETLEKQLTAVNMDEYPGAIWVDIHGKRRIDESGGMRLPKTRLAVGDAPEMTLIVIIDEKIKAGTESILNNMFDEGGPWEVFEEHAKLGRLIKMADTIEELAEKEGIDPAALKETVTTYNGYVDAGNDPDFDRQELKYKIENPPFYSIRTVPLVIMSSGGPAHNDKQQVIDETGKIIPGIYVAGEVSGYRGFGTGGGNTGSLVFGKRAGQMAAEYALRCK